MTYFNLVGLNSPSRGSKDVILMIQSDTPPACGGVVHYFMDTIANKEYAIACIYRLMDFSAIQVTTLKGQSPVYLRYGGFVLAQSNRG